MMISSEHYQIAAVEYTINYYQKNFTNDSIYLSVQVDMKNINFNSYQAVKYAMIMGDNDNEILSIFERLKDMALEELSHKIYGSPRVFYPNERDWMQKKESFSA